MKVLVTGATGFVGQTLVPELINRGYSVVCLVRNMDKGKALFGDTVSLVQGDTTDPLSLKSIPEDINYVIHLAAVGHISAVTDESFALFVGVNETGTQNLINELKTRKELIKFIHFSSTAAMGPIGTPIQNESSIPNPTTPYQKSKNRSEKIVREASSNGFPGVILRPCMIYGVGGYGEFYKFCKLMKKGFFPKVGLGKNLTPLVNVKDVVNAAILAMDNGIIGETYIIASADSIPMDELRNLIISNIGKWSPYIFVPSFLALFGAKLIETVSPLFGKEPIVTTTNIRSTILDRTFDISKAESELGYKPRISFKDGIRETVLWYKANGKI